MRLYIWIMVAPVSFPFTLFCWAQQKELPPIEPDTPATTTESTPPVSEKPVIPFYEVIRVSEPSVFHVKASGLEVRLKAWGIGCPKRGQPGYREALRFAEERLLGLKVRLEVKREFDPDGYKQVLVYPQGEKINLNRTMIALGHAWHLEKVTKRHGPFALAQIKAKRERSGVWKSSYAYDFEGSADAAPRPALPSLLRNQGQGSAVRIMYWQSFVGKVHGPGCAFYSRGSGIMTPNPQGRDCGVCGGRQGPRR
jgi:endonuclease YncB( thermonuclease family)